MTRPPQYYSGTGDEGTTDLLGDRRVRKDHPITEALGTLDELQAVLGVARAQAADAEVNDLIYALQKELWALMGELATPRQLLKAITEERVEWITGQTEAFGARITMPRGFTISGGDPLSAQLNLARTIARRAERRVVAMEGAGMLDNPLVLQYLNRMSSLLFVLSLFAGMSASSEEEPDGG